MNVALQKPWTVDAFLAWAGAQDGRYEFDGVRPVAMAGGNARHSLIINNIHFALRSRLRGTRCSHYGPDLAVRTEGEKVRSPDALITCTKFPQTALLAPDVVVVFEVLSPTSERTDKHDKVREYAMVPSIRRYVIVDSKLAGLLIYERNTSEVDWTERRIEGDQTLEIPEVRISIPMAEIYEGIEFLDQSASE
jgi:Uma2 family endonuclease